MSSSSNSPEGPPNYRHGFMISDNEAIVHAVIEEMMKNGSQDYANLDRQFAGSAEQRQILAEILSKMPHR